MRDRGCRCRPDSRRARERRETPEEPAACYPRARIATMGTDGLVELDGECWIAFAKYNLLLATAFGVLAVAVRTTLASSELLVVENAAFALFFGAVQTYAWLSA